MPRSCPHGDPDDFCILHSQDKSKSPGTFQFALRARWDRADQEFYDFRGVWFPRPFFPREVFESREFTKPVDFSKATFTEEAVFMGATFTERANFSKATFAAWANFSGATFRKEADFSWARITSRVVFRDINPRDEVGRALPFIGIFRSLEFQDRGVLRFQDVILTHCTFTGTDLRRPEFRHATWHRLRGGRQALYDEVLLMAREISLSERLAIPHGLVVFALEIGPEINTFLAEAPQPSNPPTTDDYAEVERLYRNLKMNYIGEGDNKNAGDFHYGEMEMHCRASKWRWFPFYWYNLYWFLSGYGERPSRALGWLAGFLLALPLLVWGFGLDRVTGGTSPGFLETFTYIFEKATFQRPPLLSNLNLLGRFISNLSLLIIPGQATLFLLALRNRLGRRR